MPPADNDTPEPPLGLGRSAAIAAVKSVHSVAFLVIQSCILYLAYSGLRGWTDWRAGIAAGVALAESAVYAGNGFRCPLTGVAERLGSKHGQVTDIFLPKWLADNIANIYTPLLAIGIVLHGRNLRRGWQREHVDVSSAPPV